MRPVDLSGAAASRRVSLRDTVPRILLLGGTGDAVTIARQLRRDDCYSVAGLGSLPTDLPCHVREGGFGGVEGLTQALRTGGYGLLVDATHPYAAQISTNALAAARRCGVPYWRLERPAWTATSADHWIDVDDWPQTLEAVSGFRRPLWTLGREPLAHTDSARSGQHWFVRCLPGTAARHAVVSGDADADAVRAAGDRACLGGYPAAMDHGDAAAHAGSSPRITIIPARGPFTLASERALIMSLGIDVIVSKNSGGGATDAKLQVARDAGLPVIMRRRPTAPWERHIDVDLRTPGEDATAATSPDDACDRDADLMAAYPAMDLYRRPICLFDSAEAVLQAFPTRYP